jgi:hypothetical protein
MKSEVVRMDIHQQLIKVDCNFVFHNSSKAAATVRMGFPDQGMGAAEPYQGDPLPTKNLKATFLTYESYVDGKKVPTKLVPTNDRSLFWHTKMVTFKPESDCIIRDTYTLKPGAQMTNEDGMYRQTSYVLHTGASWHGPIGKAEIIINMGTDALKEAPELKPLSALPDQDLQHMKWSELPKNIVVYDGPSKPTLEGRTIRFTVSNLRPTKKDDIILYYGFKLNTNMPKN